MAASSIHCIFTGPRGHLEKVLKITGGHRNGRQLDSLHFYMAPWPPRRNAKNNHDIPRVSFAKVLKIQGCFEEARQLDSLHICGVSWPRG